MTSPPAHSTPREPEAILASLRADPAFQGFARALEQGSRVVSSGAVGSAPALLAAALHAHTGRTVVCVLAHIDDADEALDEIESLGVPALRLPALEVLPGESDVSLELYAERLAVVRRLAQGETPGVVLAPIQGLMQLVPAPAQLAGLARTLRVGSDYPLGELIEWLTRAGYQRVEAIEEAGEFAIRGGILDVFSPGAPSSPATPGAAAAGFPVRLDFFGDTLERASEIDLDTMGSDRAVASADLLAVDTRAASGDEGRVNFLELVPREALALIVETMEVVEQGRGYYERALSGVGLAGPPAVLSILESRFHALGELNQFSLGAARADVRVELPARPLPSFAGETKQALADLASLAREHSGVLVCCQNEGEAHRLVELLREHQTPDNVRPCVRYLHRGFAWASESPDASIALVPYHELLNRFMVRRRGGRLRSARAMDTFLDFQVGDYVVHADHGIAQFAGLSMMTPREIPGVGAKARQAPEQEEYLTLEFAGRSKLHVPAVQIDKVQKYVGGFAGKPPLSTLGGQRWKAQKQRVADSVRDLAAELLRVRAAREHMPGIQYPADTPWQREFEDQFPYTETEDQLASLAEIKRDMQSPRPMDRLICGDVGFGKTELAIRAAFKACEFGRQVAVLVPTTVLAEQHERTFRARFAGYPFRIESLSRFKSTKQSNDTLGALRKGHVDVIIGTHRLLSSDVKFADLGLVVVDEEQRFGVEHKEALLRLRLTVDVLTLSATPIPRTLHMAMLGIRDISSLTTAPLDRRAIVTEVIPFNERRIQQAIRRELSRDGQAFVVHNRVYDILSFADSIRALVPEARVVVGHGQMDPHELEDVMLRFLKGPQEGGADVLVSTTIIESGIDIPTANTIIIHDADRFGLADLHQLRGRVGRSKHRGYCYLLLPPDRTVREVAQKRLKAIEQYSMLGAGFKIAMRDLEIRGAGNILGSEQSGHIAAVGYEMYCRLLEDGVRELHGQPRPATASSVSVELGIGGSIPRGYIPSEPRRLEAYRRLANAASPDQLDAAVRDIVDAYGQPPKPAQRLFDLISLRIAAAQFGVRTLTIRERDVVFLVGEPQPLAQRLALEPPRPPGAHPAKAFAKPRPPLEGPPQGVRVSVLPPSEPGAPSEVYLRLPENYFEPQTLLRVLARRLRPPEDVPPARDRPIPGEPAPPAATRSPR